MARARNIKPGFFKNEDLAECTAWTRLCFAGLWTLADREGRLEDRPKRIKGEIFPYDSVEVEPLLVELSQWGFILRYQVNGERFIQIVKFVEHQAPHGTEKDSLIPDAHGFLTVHERGKNGYATGNSRLEPYAKTVKAPELGTPSASSLTVIGGMSEGGQNPLIPDSLIPDSPNPEETPQPPKGGRRSKPAGGDADPEGFAEWYALYQRKDARADAVKAWRQLSPNADLQATLIGALRRWSWNPDRTKIPLPASWLRGRRWEDEAVAGVASGAAPGGPPWWAAAGFPNRHEANNARCYEHNAHEFHGGQRIEEPAA